MPLLAQMTGAPLMAVTYLNLPGPAWSLFGASAYTIAYWLKASKQGRNPKALTNRTVATFCLAAFGGMPVSYFALDFVDHNWAWTRTWPSITPIVAATTGMVGHKLLNLFGERLLGWAHSEGANEALTSLKDKNP